MSILSAYFQKKALEITIIIVPQGVYYIKMD